VSDLIITPAPATSWRVDVLCDCHLHTTTAYEGGDYQEACKRIGEMCLSITVDRVIVYRNGEWHRRIELK
jgi:hypothetical protein